MSDDGRDARSGRRASSASMCGTNELGLLLGDANFFRTEHRPHCHKMSLTHFVFTFFSVFDRHHDTELLRIGSDDGL